MNNLPDQIVLFGDSLTQRSFDANNNGWGALLLNAYVRKLDVFNRGYSGYNTKCAKYILPQLLPTSSSLSPKIRLLIIFLGANDCAIPPSFQHVPLQEYKQNLEWLVDLVKNPESKYYSPETRVLLVTPPPLDNDAWEKFCREQERTRFPRDVTFTKSYVDACKEVALRIGVPCADVWSGIMNRLGERKIDENGNMKELKLTDFLCDGLHLGGLGNETIFNVVLDSIRKNWPELDPEKLPLILPDFLSLDMENLEECLKFPFNEISKS
ncbi:12233_t:CDS:2 [Ambispora leptoticha]|uniref:12233_t:CDS:1 n=1 Tax=Ambispora leptoticha TaxID=144679 RepID=A0A9N9D3I8_9GLOM|nr:12233_t:CDS:2 [Ambispora leptoticha]